MLTDNDPPFATVGVTGLSALGVWWAKLGIHHERIARGKPQQNGRHERFHLTLNEAMEPPSLDWAAQADRFEAIRTDYNHERPHQAFNQTLPAQHYGAIAAAAAEAAAGAGLSSRSRHPPGPLERRDHMGR